MADPPPGSKAWRVLYVSTGLDEEPIVVSGVVIAPELPPPLAGRPVVAWAHPTTGVAENCAPSLRDGIFDSIPHLQALIALDYVEDGIWNDAAYLESIRHRAERFVLGDAATQTLALKIATP